MAAEDFFDLVKADPMYKKYRSVLKTVKEDGADILAIKNEGKSLHATRSSRSLHQRKTIPSKLIEAEAQDSSHRSRLVEMMVSLTNAQELLETTIKEGKKYLKGKYSEEYAALASAATARQVKLDLVFAKGVEYLEQLNTAVAILKMYIGDIDASGYKHSNIRELMKIEFAKRDTV